MKKMWCNVFFGEIPTVVQTDLINGCGLYARKYQNMQNTQRLNTLYFYTKQNMSLQ